MHTVPYLTLANRGLLFNQEAVLVQVTTTRYFYLGQCEQHSFVSYGFGGWEIQDYQGASRFGSW